MDSQLKNRMYNPLIVIGLFAFLLPFIIVSFYLFPTTDDFCNVITNRGVTVWDRLVFVYLHWSGRYTPALMGFLGEYVIANIPIYTLLPIVWITLLVFLMFRLIRVFEFSAFTSISIAIIVIAVFLSCMPALGSGLYWYTSARVYLLGIIFSLWYIIELIVWLNKSSTRYTKVLLILLAIVSVGTNESIAGILVLVHICIYIMCKKTEKNFFNFLSVILIVFTLISFFAPGNFERTEYIPKPDMFYMVFQAVSYTLFYAVSWFFTPFLFLISIGFFILGVKSNFLIPQTRTIWLIPIVIIFVIFSGVAPSVFGLGGIGGERMLNPSFFYFILLVFSFFFLVGVKYRNAIQQKYILILIYSIPFLFIPSYFFAPNTQMIYKDFSESNFTWVKNYTRTMYETKQIPKSITINKLPKTFSYMILPTQGKHWGNDCMKKVYEFKE